jgi:hypothetical protein
MVTPQRCNEKELRQMAGPTARAKTIARNVRRRKQERNPMDEQTPCPHCLPAGQLWINWFEKVGELATVDVINATATLVIEEKKLAQDSNLALIRQLRGALIFALTPPFDVETGREQYERVITAADGVLGES